MTQPQTLSLEYQELMDRADELETALPEPPPGDSEWESGPRQPSIFLRTLEASQQLSFSADSMRLYLSAGQRERNRLAESLRTAAKAYEQLDESAGDAISGDGTGGSTPPPESAPGEGAATAGSNITTVTPTSYETAYSFSKTSTASGNYFPVEDVAFDLPCGDAGAGCYLFADQWSAYQRTLLESTQMFRPFQYWEGDAATAVEAAFDQHRSWLYQMADLCATLISQARGLASATTWANSAHPGYEEVAKAYQKKDQKKYVKLQQQSEEVLAEYEQRAALPLPAVQPPMPPTAPSIGTPGDSTLPWDDYPGDGGIGDGGSGAGDGGAGSSDAGSTDDGLGSDRFANTPTNPANGLPTNTTPTDDAALSDTWTPTPDPSLGSGVKPASFGGGGIGGGMPSMPLQTPIEAESAARAATARAAGLGGITPAGALGGRGGMGMAPMAPGAGQNQGQNGKAKRVSQDEHALYTEKRPWTSGIIGKRRRNDAPDTDNTN